MQFSITRQSLDLALSMLTSLTGNSTLSEVASKVMVELDGYHATLSAVSDGVVARAKCTMPNPVSLEEPIFVAKKYFYLLSQYESGVTFEIEETGLRARCGKAETTMNWPTEESPASFIWDEPEEMGVPFSLPDRLPYILYPDPIPDYNVIYAHGNKLMCIDGTGLVAVLVRKDGVSIDHKMALPKKMTDHLLSKLGQFTISSSGDYGHIYVHSPMFEARFTGLSPIDFIATIGWQAHASEVDYLSDPCLIDKSELVRELRVANIVADENPSVMIWVNDGVLNISSSQQIGGFEAKIDCDGGDGLATKVSAKRLFSAVQAVSSGSGDEILLQYYATRLGNKLPSIEFRREDDQVREYHRVYPMHVTEEEANFLNAFRKSP